MNAPVLTVRPMDVAGHTARRPLPLIAVRLGNLLARINGFSSDPFADASTARPIPGRRDNPAPTAVLVIDASPSMNDTDWPPSRLDAAKEAARAYVLRLNDESPTAQVAVVAFHKHAKTICPLTPVHRHGIVAKALEAIDTSSATNITAGLQNAQTLLKRCQGPSQVVLLTDGAHNHGPRPNAIAAKLRQIATLEIVGIGGSPQDVDEALLREIASADPDGRKHYRWIGDKAQLVSQFQALAGRLARS